MPVHALLATTDSSGGFTEPREGGAEHTTKLVLGAASAGDDQPDAESRSSSSTETRQGFPDSVDRATAIILSGSDVVDDVSAVQATRAGEAIEGDFIRPQSTASASHTCTTGVHGQRGVSADSLRADVRRFPAPLADQQISPNAIDYPQTEASSMEHAAGTDAAPGVEPVHTLPLATTTKISAVAESEGDSVARVGLTTTLDHLSSSQRNAASSIADARPHVVYPSSPEKRRQVLSASVDGDIPEIADQRLRPTSDNASETESLSTEQAAGSDRLLHEVPEHDLPLATASAPTNGFSGAEGNGVANVDCATMMTQLDSSPLNAAPDVESLSSSPNDGRHEELASSDCLRCDTPDVDGSNATDDVTVTSNEFTAPEPEVAAEVERATKPVLDAAAASVDVARQDVERKSSSPTESRRLPVDSVGDETPEVAGSDGVDDVTAIRPSHVSRTVDAEAGQKNGSSTPMPSVCRSRDMDSSRRQATGSASLDQAAAKTGPSSRKVPEHPLPLPTTSAINALTEPEGGGRGVGNPEHTTKLVLDPTYTDDAQADAECPSSLTHSRRVLSEPVGDDTPEVAGSDVTDDVTAIRAAHLSPTVETDLTRPQSTESAPAAYVDGERRYVDSESPSDQRMPPASVDFSEREASSLEQAVESNSSPISRPGNSFPTAITSAINGVAEPEGGSVANVDVMPPTPGCPLSFPPNAASNGDARPGIESLSSQNERRRVPSDVIYGDTPEVVGSDVIDDVTVTPPSDERRDEVRPSSPAEIRQVPSASVHGDTPEVVGNEAADDVTVTADGFRGAEKDSVAIVERATTNRFVSTRHSAASTDAARPYAESLSLSTESRQLEIVTDDITMTSNGSCEPEEDGVEVVERTSKPGHHLASSVPDVAPSGSAEPGVENLSYPNESRQVRSRFLHDDTPETDEYVTDDVIATSDYFTEPVDDSCANVEHTANRLDVYCLLNIASTDDAEAEVEILSSPTDTPEVAGSDAVDYFTVTSDGSTKPEEHGVSFALSATSADDPRPDVGRLSPPNESRQVLSGGFPRDDTPGDAQSLRGVVLVRQAVETDLNRPQSIARSSSAYAKTEGHDRLREDMWSAMPLTDQRISPSSTDLPETEASSLEHAVKSDSSLRVSVRTLPLASTANMDGFNQPESGSVAYADFTTLDLLSFSARNAASDGYDLPDVDGPSSPDESQQVRSDYLRSATPEVGSSDVIDDITASSLPAVGVLIGGAESRNRKRDDDDDDDDDNDGDDVVTSRRRDHVRQLATSSRSSCRATTDSSDSRERSDDQSGIVGGKDAAGSDEATNIRESGDADNIRRRRPLSSRAGADRAVDGVANLEQTTNHIVSCLMLNAAPSNGDAQPDVVSLSSPTDESRQLASVGSVYSDTPNVAGSDVVVVDNVSVTSPSAERRDRKRAAAAAADDDDDDDGGAGDDVTAWRGDRRLETPPPPRASRRVPGESDSERQSGDECEIVDGTDGAGPAEPLTDSGRPGDSDGARRCQLSTPAGADPEEDCVAIVEHATRPDRLVASIGDDQRQPGVERSSSTEIRKVRRDSDTPEVAAGGDAADDDVTVTPSSAERQRAEESPPSPNGESERRVSSEFLRGDATQLDDNGERRSDVVGKDDGTGFAEPTDRTDSRESPDSDSVRRRRRSVSLPAGAADPAPAEQRGASRDQRSTTGSHVARPDVTSPQRDGDVGAGYAEKAFVESLATGIGKFSAAFRRAVGDVVAFCRLKTQDSCIMANNIFPVQNHGKPQIWHPEADLDMFSMFGRTGAPAKRGPPNGQFFVSFVATSQK